MMFKHVAIFLWFIYSVKRALSTDQARYISPRCWWEQEVNASTLKFRVDLVGFCALAPLVRNPCEAERTSKTFKPIRPVYEQRFKNFTSGNWPFCGMRARGPGSRKQYLCAEGQDLEAVSIGSITAENFVIDSLKKDVKNRIVIIGDSLAGQKFDLASCLFARRTFGDALIQRVDYNLTHIAGPEGEGINGIRTIEVFVSGRNHSISIVLLTGSKWLAWETLLNHTELGGMNDVLVMNFGLHYAITDNVTTRHDIMPNYIADMKAMISYFDSRPATNKIWSMTTAVHLRNLPVDVKRDKFHIDSNVYVTRVNTAARALLQHRRDWSLTPIRRQYQEKTGCSPKMYGTTVVK